MPFDFNIFALKTDTGKPYLENKNIYIVIYNHTFLRPARTFGVYACTKELPCIYNVHVLLLQG